MNFSPGQLASLRCNDFYFNNNNNNNNEQTSSDLNFLVLIPSWDALGDFLEEEISSDLSFEAVSTKGRKILEKFDFGRREKGTKGIFYFCAVEL